MNREAPENRRNADMGNQYYQIVEITDLGPFVTRLVLCMPREIMPEEVRPDMFSVHVEIHDKNGEIVKLPKSFLERDVFVPSIGYRECCAAYPGTAEGGKTDGASRYVVLEMRYGPRYRCSSAQASDYRNINGHARYTVSRYRVTLTEDIGEGSGALSGLVFDQCAGVVNPALDGFQKGVSRDPDLPLRYAYYTPKKLDGKKPLIIFLHGAGEGGQDLDIPYTGNRVTAFADRYAQEIFGGAFVLVPQCDTMWLDDGSGKYGDSGKSMYTAALKSLIDEFLEDHRQVIDPARVYVGGDSNGGFMTMRMIMDYPELFAAAFPICEAMPDKRISDADIRRLAEMPIWFTHAKNDPVVVPDKFVLPTYQRLMAAGARNCHFTFWDRIMDLHDRFPEADGSAHEYFGHFAWVPVFNDDCRLDFDGKPVRAKGRNVSLMEWLAQQKKSRRSS